MLRGVTERGIRTTESHDGVLAGDRGAIAIRCEYPPGRAGVVNAADRNADGRIARWEGVQAWISSWPRSMARRTTMSTPTTIDPDRVETFAGRVLGDLAGTMATVLSILGDQLGLFTALADEGPASSAELADGVGGAFARMAPRPVRRRLPRVRPPPQRVRATRRARRGARQPKAARSSSPAATKRSAASSGCSTG